MTTQVNNYVLLPKGYDPSGDTRYPVLYLLHGADGHYSDWITMGNAQKLIDQETAADHLAPFITVMPDGGLWGMYSDWYGEDAGDASPPPAYTTYDIHELIPWIDANFPVLTGRRDRAVAGLSMGGLGAMSYAARYPDLFSVAGSFSGAVDTDLDYPAGNELLTAISVGFTDGLPDACVWGDPTTDDVYWRADDPTYLASNLHGVSLFVASGNGEPGPLDTPSSDAGGSIEATVWEMNQAFAGALQGDGIPFTSYFYGPGTHSWPYWQRDLVHFLPQMEAAFAHPVATPPQVPFSYRTDASSFSVWGWSFAGDHPATEFTYLSKVDRAGLTVVGSGNLSVTTAALYEPGATYTVHIQVPPSTSTLAVRSDSHGRLRFTVPLGPGDTTQQMLFNSDGTPPANWVQARVVIEPTAGTYACARPSGGLIGRSLGPVRLGMTRAQARGEFARFSRRGRRFMDFFCTGDNGIRVGYPSPALLRSVSATKRRRLSGRVVLILTSSRHYALRGVLPGVRLAAVAGRLRVSRPYPLGLNTWYLVPDGAVRGVLKVRHGAIEEIGIADPLFGSSRREARIFFSSFS
jgi:S-formylglutathione hydrolase FrmB